METLSELYLPEGAILVERLQEEETKGTIILNVTPVKSNKGTIIATCKSLSDFIGKTVVFRENFSEEIEIEGYKNILYFRDFNSSIYYAK